MAETFTQDDLDRIDRAITSGHRRVRFADREVEYKNGDDLLKLRAAIKASIDAGGPKKRRRVIRLLGSVD